MGYRVKPFTMSVRNNSTQEFVDVGLLGSDVDADVQDLKDKTFSYVTPEMFGAKADEVTDDTAAIQAAITYVSNNDLTGVYFPGSGYVVTSEIVINKNISLWGSKASATSTFIKARGNLPCVFHVKYVSVAFHNLDFEHDNYTTNTDTIAIFFDSSEQSGGYGYNCDGIVVETRFRGFAEGIRLYGRSLTVRSCGFSYCGYGIHIVSDSTIASEALRGIDIQNSRFHYIGNNQGNLTNSAAIFSDIEATTEICEFYIANNYCDYSSFFFIGILSGGVISDNYITNVINGGIRIVPSANLSTLNNIIPTIRNNYIESKNRGYRGIYIKWMSLINLENNTVVGFRDYHLRCELCDVVNVNGFIFKGTTSAQNLYFVGCNHIYLSRVLEIYSTTHNEVSIKSVNSSENAPSTYEYIDANVLGNIYGYYTGQTKTITAATNVTINSQACIKQGNHVMVALNVTPSAAISAGSPVCILPTGCYRLGQSGSNLATYISHISTLNGTLVDYIGNAYVDGNGNILLTSTLQSGQQTKFTLDFYV